MGPRPAPRWPRTGVRPLVWLLALLPLGLLLRDALTGGLGPEPFETLTHRTGYWGLVLLLASLAVTPLRRLTGWNGLAPLRRLVGLFAFFYLTLHFAVYLTDQAFEWRHIAEDIAKHPYVMVGFAAYLMLVPLALTSTRAAIRRLGRRWQQLHRLVYLAATLGVVHFLWLVKADLREPLLFAAALAVLLLMRLRRPKRRGARAAAETRLRRSA
jgi:methionine sulfoxide reductase heme-binding subunit